MTAVLTRKMFHRCSHLRPNIRSWSSSNNSTNKQPDPGMVDGRNAPSDFTASCAVVYRDFLTPAEGELLTQDILSRMKRRRYEKGHWDAVITNYKEVELADAFFDKPEIPHIFQRIRQHLEQNELRDFYHDETIHWLPCHAIDLKREGELNAHVDSIKFSGELVAGISLLSASIMRLIPDKDSDENKDVDNLEGGWVDLYLPPLSLYVLTGVGRFRYSHQLLPNNSIFTSPEDGKEIVVERDHRLSVIFRDTKHHE